MSLTQRIPVHLVIPMVVAVAAPYAHAQTAADEAPDEPLVRLDLETELEMQFVNVEGPGGFEAAETSQLRADNRSARIELDKLVVAPTVWVADLVSVRGELRGDDDGAYADRAFLATRWLEPYDYLGLRFELGKNTPFVRPKRRTEAYPLLGTTYWKGRENHALAEARIELGPVTIEAGLSGAQKRPLDFEEPAEDKSFNLVVLGDTALQQGANFTMGGKLRIAAFGASLLGYGFVGELMDNHDTQLLDQNLRDYAGLGERDDATHHYLGGRARYDGYGAHLVAEAVVGQDGLLPRIGWYAQASYDFGELWDHDHWLRSIEPIGRWGQLILEDLPANPDEPESWDREMIVAGVLVGLSPYFTVKTEYYVLNEITEGSGGPAVFDNELVILLEAKLNLNLLPGGSQ